jgi:hypothetical protein
MRRTIIAEKDDGLYGLIEDHPFETTEQLRLCGWHSSRAVVVGGHL